jgi:hypothetical protein
MSLNYSLDFRHANSRYFSPLFIENLERISNGKNPLPQSTDPITLSKNNNYTIQMTDRSLIQTNNLEPEYMHYYSKTRETYNEYKNKTRLKEENEMREASLKHRLKLEMDLKWKTEQDKLNMNFMKLIDDIYRGKVRGSYYPEKIGLLPPLIKLRDEYAALTPQEKITFQKQLNAIKLQADNYGVSDNLTYQQKQLINLILRHQTLPDQPPKQQDLFPKNKLYQPSDKGLSLNDKVQLPLSRSQSLSSQTSFSSSEKSLRNQIVLPQPQPPKPGPPPVPPSPSPKPNPPEPKPTTPSKKK